MVAVRGIHTQLASEQDLQLRKNSSGQTTDGLSSRRARGTGRWAGWRPSRRRPRWRLGSWGGLSGAGPPPGLFGGPGGKRYSLEFSVMARNLLNTVNLAAPIGNLSSPLFGRSNALAGGMFSTATANRRIEFLMMFRF